MHRYTYTVTETSFPNTGVVQHTEVASSLTRGEVLTQFGPAVKFIDRDQKAEPKHVAPYYADPEWK
jgi:hypothetical protein